MVWLLVWLLVRGGGVGLLTSSITKSFTDDVSGENPYEILFFKYFFTKIRWQAYCYFTLPTFMGLHGPVRRTNKLSKGMS